jgi:hypothetical protein
VEEEEDEDEDEDEEAKDDEEEEAAELAAAVAAAVEAVALRALPPFAPRPVLLFAALRLICRRRCCWSFWKSGFSNSRQLRSCPLVWKLYLRQCGVRGWNALDGECVCRGWEGRASCSEEKRREARRSEEKRGEARSSGAHKHTIMFASTHSHIRTSTYSRREVRELNREGM